MNLKTSIILCKCDFAEKIRHDRLLQKFTHKERESEMNYIKRLQNTQDSSV